MDSSHKSKCRKIIHTASASASAAATELAQIPGSDAIPITEGLGRYVANDFAKDSERAAQPPKRPHLDGAGQVMMCIVFFAVLAVLWWFKVDRRISDYWGL